jgi:hypothetical protein
MLVVHIFELTVSQGGPEREQFSLGPTRKRHPNLRRPKLKLASS